MGVKKGDHLSLWAYNVPEWGNRMCRIFAATRSPIIRSPDYVRFVQGYPLTASDKIQKFKLREMAIRELQLEGAG